jgi:RNA-directed DNA polymerase
MYENLMETAVSPENYGKALRAVIANQGAPGMDGMTVEELNGHLLQHWPKIHGKWRAGTYVPSPVRRVEIAKPNGGTRKLGIPTVLDRFIEQRMLQARMPI